ncbi:MAG TPA: ferredoxin reductase family protein [Acidimicrobiales bacterium]|nr:ferredoxin reductase family protein [Acidimicrobiales bacterium]
MVDDAKVADRAYVATVVIVANALITVGLWWRHGGVAAASGPGGVATAAGQLTGLLGTYAVLVVLLLMSRIAWLERAIGFDRLAVWHRWGGFASVWLLVAHAGLITVGYAQGEHVSLVSQTGDFIRHYPDVLMAIVGTALFVAVGAASVRAARRRLRRETWYGLHLYAYLAVALTFAHQLAVGTDFSGDPVARGWWIALYAAVGGSVLWWRIIAPIAFNRRHRLTVRAVHPEAAGTVSIFLRGAKLDATGARPGQFFLWRFMTPDGWSRAHPFSLSAAPRSDVLRITVKALGDDTERIATVPVGTRVFAEGPYGTFTSRRRQRRRVAFIAGGIGITPLRALLDEVRPDTDAVLVYRAADETDIAFRRELEMFSERRGVRVQYVVGPEIGDDETDKLGIPALRALVPDIASRDVYVCGPPGMVDAVRRRLRRLRVADRQIHFERFAY